MVTAIRFDTAEEEQLKEVADLPPLGERARHAARYYPAGDHDGLSQSGGPADERYKDWNDDRGPEDPEVAVLEEAEEEPSGG